MAYIGFEVLNLAKKYGAVFTDDRHFADDCAKLVEEKFTSTNKPKPQLSDDIKEKFRQFVIEQVSLPLSFADVVNEHFWDLI